MTETNRINYVANQFTPEGIDEVQWLILTHALGQNAAMAGAPGVGKTEIMQELAKLVSGQKLLQTTCDERMTESPLVGFPVLKGNGCTKTDYQNGIVTDAMELGRWLLLDEFNKLDGSLQKRLNSAFDKRRSLHRRDGIDVDARQGFFAAIAYNPSRTRDLEESVADRFVHKQFLYLPKELEAGIALRMAGIGSLGISTERRGIAYSNNSQNPVFVRDNKSSWVDCFTGKPVKADKIIEYDAVPFVRTSENGIEGADINALAKRLAAFNDNIRLFANTGKKHLPAEIQNYLTSIGEIGQVNLHLPSPRTTQYSIAQANLLMRMGMTPKDAVAYATRLAVDQICYGSYRNRVLEGEYRVYDAVADIAKSLGLLPKKEVRSDFE